MLYKCLKDLASESQKRQAANYLTQTPFPNDIYVLQYFWGLGQILFYLETARRFFDPSNHTWIVTRIMEQISNEDIQRR